MNLPRFPSFSLPNPWCKCSLFTTVRSSHQKCSIKKGVLKNFAKLTRKLLCQSPFFDKVAGLTEHLRATASCSVLDVTIKHCN